MIRVKKHTRNNLRKEVIYGSNNNFKIKQSR